MGKDKINERLENRMKVLKGLSDFWRKETLKQQESTDFWLKETEKQKESTTYWMEQANIWKEKAIRLEKGTNKSQRRKRYRKKPRHGFKVIIGGAHSKHHRESKRKTRK